MTYTKLPTAFFAVYQAYLRCIIQLYLQLVVDHYGLKYSGPLWVRLYEYMTESRNIPTASVAVSRVGL
jgi:hypothetical protein